MHPSYKLLVVAVVTLVTIALTILDQTHLTIDNAPAPVAAPASLGLVPNVTFDLLDGGSIPIHSLVGHVVWLHFWASWCVPCRAEFPAMLKKLALEDNNTVLLAVSADANAQDAKRFMAPLQQEFKPLFDSGRVVLAQDRDHSLIEGVFQTFQYPETIILDKQLAMRRKIIGILK